LLVRGKIVGLSFVRDSALLRAYVRLDLQLFVAKALFFIHAKNSRIFWSYFFSNQIPAKKSGFRDSRSSITSDDDKVGAIDIGVDLVNEDSI